MFLSLSPYPTYTEPGAHRIGKVPIEWSPRRLRDVSRQPIKNGIGESAQEFRDDWPRYIRITDIAGPRALRSHGRASLPPEIADSARLEPGDLLVAAVGATYGKSYLYAGETGTACFAGYLVRVAPNESVLPQFLSYWTESAQYWDQVDSQVVQSTIQNFSAGRYKGLRIAVPPLRDQSAIVRFLDYFDSRSRRYLAARKKQIRLLIEQKQAIVHRAVTDGLDSNPDLQPLGSSPAFRVNAAWPVARLWNVAKVRSERNHAELDLLSVFLGRGVIPYNEGGGQVHKPTLDLSGYQVVYPGDLVLNNQQAWRGSVGVSAHHGIISPAYVVLVLESFSQRFADYLFQSQLLVAQYVTASKGVGDIQRDVHIPWLKNIRVPVPPCDEQGAIAARLDRELDEIEGRLALCIREMDLLREYRTRLITDVVAGALDVRDAASRLPAEHDAAGSVEDERGLGDDDEQGVALDSTELESPSEEVEA